MDLSDLRLQIDDLDRQIVELLNRRAAIAVEIGKRKEAATSAVFAPDRERHVIENAIGNNEGPLPAQSIRSIYREIISSTRALEQPVVIAYWGPPTTNTHLASIYKFGSAATFVPQDTIPDVFEEVERQEADFGVVPIENSIEGIVNHTLDMFLRSDLKICAEIYLQISHCLLSSADNLEDVKKIYSNPVATGQCRRWLNSRMRGVEIVAVSTTARAAMIARDNPEAGAIANSLAAEEYSLNILANHIEDNPANKTRFLAIGRIQPKPSGRDKTSIVVSVPHRSGALLTALEVFARLELNLTMIESRPTKLLPWEYVFYIDVQGHQSDAQMAKAIEKLGECATFVKVLGSYPEAD
ncbi:MAG: prephenate dehydratase [Armatimonadetes bacterium]|nr:prephenate dehydratase [Armatimonadota bacterium]